MNLNNRIQNKCYDVTFINNVLQKVKFAICLLYGNNYMNQEKVRRGHKI